MPERAGYAVVFPGLKAVSKASFQVGYGKGRGYRGSSGHQKKKRGGLKAPSFRVAMRTRTGNYLIFPFPFPCPFDVALDATGVSQSVSQGTPTNLPP